jgi:hypothetical protein
MILQGMSPLLILTWIATAAALLAAASVMFARRPQGWGAGRRWAALGLVMLAASGGASIVNLVSAGYPSWWSLITALAAAAAILCLAISIIGLVVRDH